MKLADLASGPDWGVWIVFVILQWELLWLMLWLLSFWETRYADRNNFGFLY